VLVSKSKRHKRLSRFRRLAHAQLCKVNHAEEWRVKRKQHVVYVRGVAADVLYIPDKKA
jgi:hypothetical protein